MPVRVDVARIAGVEPSLGILRFHGRLGILVVLLEETGRADKELALRRELQLDARDGRPDGIRLDVVIRLDADEDAGFGRAVELLKIDAERAVEDKQVRTDRLAA